jgi:type IV secretion system protein TrbL
MSLIRLHTLGGTALSKSLPKLGVALAVAIMMMHGANAESPDAANTVLGLVRQAMGPAVTKITTQATVWLGIFATLQFLITNYGLLKSDSDMQAVIAKLVGAVAWVGICLYLIENGPDFLRASGDQFMGLVGTDLPSPGNIMARTTGVTAATGALALTVGAVSNVGGQLLLYVTLGVFVLGAFFALKIFMLQLEVALVALLAPLSFALLGLNTLRDQGIAPLKSLISLAYRIVLLSVILAGYGQVSTVVVNALASFTYESILESGGIGKFLDVILSGCFAYILLGYLVYKADSIAASLASGSTSMSTADVAQAAATGAAVGAALHAAGALGAGAAGSAPSSINEFMKSLSTSGSVSNAGPVGVGGGAPPAPPAPPAFSVGGTTGGPGGGAPSSGGAAAGESAATPASQVHAKSAGAAANERSRVGVASGRYGGSDSSMRARSADAVGAVNDGGSEASGPLPASGDTERADAALSGGTGSPTEWSGDTSTVQPALAMDGGATSAGASSAGDAPGAAPAGLSQQGSGQSAAIAGANSGLEEKLGQLVDHLGAQQGPRKPSLRERVAEANRHLSQEHAATHVSVNSHHTD